MIPRKSLSHNLFSKYFLVTILLGLVFTVIPASVDAQSSPVDSNVPESSTIIVEDGGNLTYIENQSKIVKEEDNNDSDVLNVIVTEVIATVSSIVGVGLTALFVWLRKRGIPVTSEQEKMFKQVVRNRFEKLAKNSWQTMRKNPHLLDQALQNGKIPQELVDELKVQGREFALDLKDNEEFRDFAKNLTKKLSNETEDALERLLKDVRSQLKEDYQKKMLDVIPRLASVAVDAAFDKDVLTSILTDKDTDKAFNVWAETSYQKMKPLLLSSESMDNKENLMVIIQSEINKRVESRLMSDE